MQRYKTSTSKFPIPLPHTHIYIFCMREKRYNSENWTLKLLIDLYTVFKYIATKLMLYLNQLILQKRQDLCLIILLQLYNYFLDTWFCFNVFSNSYHLNLKLNCTDRFSNAYQCPFKCCKIRIAFFLLLFIIEDSCSL